jgi:hypothetical protein
MRAALRSPLPDRLLDKLYNIHQYSVPKPTYQN